jgi:hypothetical protein
VPLLATLLMPSASDTGSFWNTTSVNIIMCYDACRYR